MPNPDPLSSGMEGTQVLKCGLKQKIYPRQKTASIQISQNQKLIKLQVKKAQTFPRKGNNKISKNKFNQEARE